MSSLKELRNRINSVSSTQKITNAMKMVAAAKLRKAQNEIMGIRPYAKRMHEILMNLTESVDINENKFATSNENGDSNILLIPIASNKGLCGSFNSNVVKKTLSIAQNEAAYANVDFLLVGNKTKEVFQHKPYTIIDDQSDIFNNLTFDNSVPLANRLIDYFLNQSYDRIDIIYHQFKNAALQYLKHDQFLPLQVSEEDQEETYSRYKHYKDFIFEPSQENILETLIPQSLRTQLYKALIESFTSEHGARMTAMHQATDNASEIIKELRLEYNKARQGAITTELLEIITGAEALK